MAFPQTPLDTRVELLLGSTHITSGAVGSGGSTDSGGNCHTPDAAAFDITGDMDVRVDVAAADWTPPLTAVLAGKWVATGNQRSWSLFLNTNGTLDFSWSTAGTSGTVLSATSTAAVSASNGARKAVRATIDVVDGANKTVTFYTADTISGTWTQLGSAVTTAGNTSIFAGTADVSLGSLDGIALFGSTTTLIGKVYAFQLYSGIAGTRVAHADFTGLRAGDTEYDDNDDNPWTFEGSCAVAQDWTDVTADTLSRGEVDIVRGVPNGRPVADASGCAFELDNRTYDYTPDNPTGAHYGRIGPHSSVRASVPAATTRLVLPRAVDDYAFTHDSAGLSVTGDIDLRIDLHLPSWVGIGAILVAKYLDGSGQSSYMLLLDGSGYPWLYWSTDGTAELTAQSTLPVPRPHHGRKAVRATLDVVNGANKTVTFYTADDMDSAWVQLGDPVTTAGNTSIFNGTAECRITGWSSGWLGSAHAEVYEAQIRDGIGGSLVGNPDFTAATAGARSTTDAQGNIWYLAGTAEISDRDHRFAGEAGALTPRADPTGNDVFTPVTAGGLLRRMGQGESPLKSAYYRAFTDLADNISLGGTMIDGHVIAYYPCEDSSEAGSISSGIPGRGPIYPVPTPPDYASFTGFACSEALPTFNLAEFAFPVPSYPSPTQFQLWFLLAVPAGGVAAEYTVCRIFEVGGTDVAIWQLFVSAAGSLRLMAFDLGLGTVVDTGLVAFAVNGKLLRVSIDLQQNGTAIDYAVRTRETDGTGIATTGSLASATLGRMTKVDWNHERTLDDVAFGHITCHDTVLSSSDFLSELKAWDGEAAAERIRRLCAEEGIDHATVGDKIDTVPMGPQRPGKLLDILAEAAEADGGMLVEPRSWVGLAYRTRVSMYAQDAALTLDYASAHISSWEPDRDDQLARNDWTVSRVGGGREQKVLDDGSSMSVSPPPRGIGRRDASADLNVQVDQQLPDLASWLLHLGTAGGYRLASLRVELARAPFVASASLSAAVRALDCGDRLLVQNPPAWLPPGDLDQLALGFKERLSNFAHDFDFHSVPGGPWSQVGVYGTSRYSGDGSHLGASLTTTATSVTVETPSGPLWGAADAPYTIVVGGEEMTVTAVAGASSPQTFTVTRSANGVVKTHAEGEFVQLATLAYYAV